MNILFFDCESNGFAHFKTPSANQLTGRVISLAWELTDEKGNHLSKFGFLIKPEDGWRIPKERWWIEHGYYHEKNLQEGYPILHVLQLFMLDFNKAEVICGHNLPFDKKLVFAELNRRKFLWSNQPHEVCTMKESKHHCGLKDVRGNLKPPKLSELYQFLFGKEFIGAHQAEADVNACKECYFKLLELGIIQLPQIA